MVRSNHGLTCFNHCQQEAGKRAQLPIQVMMNSRPFEISFLISLADRTLLVSLLLAVESFYLVRLKNYLYICNRIMGFHDL
jgi:hypothetical protein